MTHDQCIQSKTVGTSKGADSPVNPRIPSAVFTATITTSLLLSLITAGAVAQTPSISLVPVEKTVDQGSATTFDIVPDGAPKGLAGYAMDVSVACPRKAEIFLATITVRGDSPGSTWLNVRVKGLDADGGGPAAASATEPAAPPCVITILGVLALSGLSILLCSVLKKTVNRLK